MDTRRQEQEKIGVVLFNLGGPETLADVRPFLYNLFSDPDIIRLPFRFLQKPLAWLIASRRYKKSSGYYAQIGGGSPLRKITNQQAEALADELQRRGLDARVYVAMRYWHPFTEAALEQINRDGITRLVFLPLYPQFSVSTTGSSLNRMNELTDEFRLDAIPHSTVCTWHTDADYIDALAAMVGAELATFPDQDPARTHIVFSAHSVPVSYIEAGDPYLAYTEQTMQAVMQRLTNERPHALSFQSKVGPVKWLEPSTDAMIRKLAGAGVEQLLLVPISFVSEHIETLYELDILYRGVAEEVGIRHYRRVPALNTNPDFIAALAKLVEREIAERSRSQTLCPYYSIHCQETPLCQVSANKP